MAGKSTRTIGKADVQRQFAYLQRALVADDDAQRDRALGEGYAQFGMAFGHLLHSGARLEHAPTSMAALCDRADEVLLRWIGGERFTQRADEDERRLVVAEEMLAMAPGQASIAGIVARAILNLPDDHPQRDLARARGFVQQRLDAARAAGDGSSFVSAAIDLLDHALVDAAAALTLYDEASQRLPIEGEEGLPRQLNLASLNYHVMAAMRARDDGQVELGVQQLDLAHRRLEAMGDAAASDRRVRQGRMMMAMLIDVGDGQEARAADAWASVRSGAAEADDLDALAGYHEGRLRLALGEHARAAELFAPLIEPARQQYLQATRDADVQTAGEHFSKLSVHHAFALGALGRWDESLRALDGSRSLRLRQRALLRGTAQGRTLLRLERELHAHERGVGEKLAADPGSSARVAPGDRLKGRVSRQAQVYERYRRLRPQIDAAALASPGMAELAAVLGDDEAVLSLGNSFSGTLAVLLRRGDGERPSRAQWFPEWSNAYWLTVMAGDETNPGWLYALGAPELELDHGRVLDDLLAAVDAGLGRWVAQAAGELGVRRLTIVAHRHLHLMPFWALPALAGIEVASAPSLAHLLASRAPRRSSSRRALLVEDPTGDLPLAGAESAAVRAALDAAGFAFEHLVHAQVVEARVAPALRHAGVLHFGGHGRSDPTHERASALLMHADTAALGLSGADPLGELAAGVDRWDDDGDGRRHAALAALGGRVRLHEWAGADGTPIERSLHYSATGTLWTLYRNGQPRRSAELWSAGDIAVGTSLRRLGVAFLSACECGASGIEPMIDEYGGLPAALLLAGVGSVVCSLWPVPESLTLLVADLFYRHLAAAGNPVDVVRTLRQCAAELRGMPRAEAGARLLALRALPLAPAQRFMLEAAAGRLHRGPEQPYAHPVHWAAFFAVGAPQIRFTARRRSARRTTG